MQHLCLHCGEIEVPMHGMKCFACAAELAMHPLPKEAAPNRERTRSDGDKGKSKRTKGKRVGDWQLQLPH